MKLEEAINQVKPASRVAAEAARKRWDSIAKPLNGLGVLEEDIVRIAAAQGRAEVSLEKKAIAVMCADNGIVTEGVTQTGQEVTSIVAGNMGTGQSCVCLMAACAGAQVIPVDVGMAGEENLPGVLNRRVAAGTRNFRKEPAMTREQARLALEAGIWTAELFSKRGIRLAGSGEMGIGNTTTSSAVASVMLGLPPEEVTGRGAGLDTAGYQRKVQVIRDGIRLHRPDPKDPVDVLSKVGGFDLGGLAGFYIGCAALRIPVVLDGLICCSAALLAAGLCPQVKDYLLASHAPAEPGANPALKALGLKPAICAGLCLGEGTGAAALFPMLDMAERVYRTMSSFEEIQVEQYQHLV